MTQAQDKVKALRKQLAEAEAVVKADRDRERQERRARELAEAKNKTDAFRENNFDFTAGDYSDYLGVTFYGDNISISAVEWTNIGNTVTLKTETAKKMMEEFNSRLG